MFSFTLAQSEKATDESGYAVFEEVTLEGLYKKHFSKCKQGKKLGSGIIRGALTDAPRCDEHLEYSKLLIIDADGGLNGNPTPPALSCHEALKKLGYSHIVYTTFSHAEGQNKYRAIVEMDDEIVRHELHHNMSQLMDELRAAGCALKYAHEMDTWSQIWFLPRSKTPDLFESYCWVEGGTFTTSHIEKTDEDIAREKSEREHTEKEFETLDEMFANIRTGQEFHQSLRTISYQLAKDGVSKALILAQLRSAMESSSEAGSERWATRMKELEKLVDGGIKRAGEEADSDFEIPDQPSFKSTYTPPPIPPGRLGRMIEQLLVAMPRPAIEFAFPMVLGTMSAVCGARFNAYTNEYSGLNLYMTIVAETGNGKGQISKFYNSVFYGGLGGRIVNLSGGDGAISFIGANNYTAPKPLHKDLEKGRSRIVCTQEAGIMLGAKSGNSDELAAYVMENYLNSDHNRFSSSRSYSSEENSMKSFRAPALSLVLESTEDSLAQALKDMNALESGYIPRQTMFKLQGRPRHNRDIDPEVTSHHGLDDDIIEQLGKLINEGSKTQAVEVFEPIVIRWTGEQLNDYYDLCDHYSDDFHLTKIDKIIASRMAHKVVKFAALCCIFNSWDSGNMKLTKEAWEWGKAMGKWEMDNIQHNLSYMSEENKYNESFEVIKLAIISALNHKDSANQKAHKVVKVSVLRDRLKRNAKLPIFAAERKMANEQFLDYVLKGMERIGWIKLLEGHHSCKKRATPCIQILEAMTL